MLLPFPSLPLPAAQSRASAEPERGWGRPWPERGSRSPPVPRPRGGDCGEICLHSLPEFPQIFLLLCRSHLKRYYIIHYLGDFQ